MADQFEYDDVSARAGARQFDQLGSDLAALLSGISSELAGDSPWSHDKIGSSFADRFDPDRSKVIGNVKDFAQTVQSVAPAVTEVADSITADDRDAAG